jgi:hypothetical protein
MELSSSEQYFVFFYKHDFAMTMLEDILNNDYDYYELASHIVNWPPLRPREVRVILFLQNQEMFIENYSVTILNVIGEIKKGSFVWTNLTRKVSF